MARAEVTLSPAVLRSPAKEENMHGDVELRDPPTESKVGVRRAVM
jgi:hypothetical protein